MPPMDAKGFTLVEVLVATVILSVSLFGLLQSMMVCQRLMTESRRYETAQYVFNLGEMAHPFPPGDKVTDDPLDNDLLNISRISALELADEIDLELTRQEKEDLAGYTFERAVDEYEEMDGGRVMDHDDELKRNGNLYTVRTTVQWGERRRDGSYDSETVIRLWRKEQ